MPAHKLNIGFIDSGPKLGDVFDKLVAFGIPKDSPVGVLEVKMEGDKIAGRFYVLSKKNVQRLDKNAKDLIANVVDSAKVYPFRLRQTSNSTVVVETYKGAAPSIEAFRELFNRAVGGKAWDVDMADVDIVQAFATLQGVTSDCKLRAASCSEYKPDTGIKGRLSAKFADSATGVQFINSNSGTSVTAVRGKFTGAKGNVAVALSKTSSFSFSCKDEDVEETMGYLRQLAGINKE